MQPYTRTQLPTPPPRDVFRATATGFMSGIRKVSIYMSSERKEDSWEHAKSHLRLNVKSITESGAPDAAEKISYYTRSAVESQILYLNFFRGSGTEAQIEQLLSFVRIAHNAGQLKPSDTISCLETIAKSVPKYLANEEYDRKIANIKAAYMRPESPLSTRDMIQFTVNIERNKKTAIANRDDAAELRRDVIQLALDTAECLKDMADDGEREQALTNMAETFWHLRAANVGNEHVVTSPLMPHNHICTVFNDVSGRRLPLAYYWPSHGGVLSVKRMIERLESLPPAYQGSKPEENPAAPCLAFLRGLSAKPA